MKKFLFTAAMAMMSVGSFAQESLTPFTMLFKRADIGNDISKVEEVTEVDATTIFTFNYGGEEKVKCFNVSKNIESVWYVAGDVEVGELDTPGREAYQRCILVDIEDGDHVDMMILSESVWVLYPDGSFVIFYDLQR